MFNYANFPRQSYLTIDVKAFYASVAALKLGLDPLTCKLAVVGDINRSGSVCLAATPKLKELGIKTGSRNFQIPKRNDIFIVNAEMEDYIRKSTEITKIMNQFVPMQDIFVYSIDEAIIKVMSSRHKANQKEFALSIADKIKEVMGLTVAIGSSHSSMLLSKVSLDLAAKKTVDGFAHWDYEDVEEMLWPIRPLSKFWGIGSRIEANLKNMGIRSIGQLAHTPVERLEQRLGKVMGQQLYQHAWGIDLSDIHKPAKPISKSYSVGQTLLRDYHTKEVPVLLLEASEEVCRRARKQKMAGKTITLVLGYSHLEGGGGFSRSVTVDEATNMTMEVYNETLKLLDMYYDDSIVRYINVSLSNVAPDHGRQISLFEDESVIMKQRQIGLVMDQIRDKYGSTAILRASSYTAGATTIKRSGMIAGHQK